jgi:integrase
VPLKTARRQKGCREREIELRPELVELLLRRRQAFERILASFSDRDDLSAYRQASRELGGSYVFATLEGKPLIHRNVSRDLFGEDGAADRAGLNREGLPRLSCHDLRHTAISRWIAAGLDPVTVARMAGDDLKTILDTYAHEFEKAKRRSAIREQLSAGTAIRLSGSES